MDELKMMHSFINDFWQFIKTHFKQSDDPDAFWDETVTAITALCKKYDNHPAVLRTAMGYLNYLEHEGSGKERVDFGK